MWSRPYCSSSPLCWGDAPVPGQGAALTMRAVFCAALPVPGTHLHSPARRQLGADAWRVAPTDAPRQRGPGRARCWLFKGRGPILCVLHPGVYYLLSVDAACCGRAAVQPVLPGWSTSTGSTQVLPLALCLWSGSTAAMSIRSLSQLRSCLWLYLFLTCTALTLTVPVHVMMS